MTRMSYRWKALLARIHTTLDDFYMRQEIDWDYDIRKLLEHILDLALKDLEFGEGKAIDRGLLIVRTKEKELEKGAGWRDNAEDRTFSRTIVEETLNTGEPILCKNAVEDEKYQNAESIKTLEIVSLVSVPILAESKTLGAIYVERRDAGHLFTEDDLAFLQEFAGTIAPYIKTALLHQEHVAQIRALQAEQERRAVLGRILGHSKAMRQALELARIAANVEKTVVITGESGSGKELFARAVHENGPRRDRPFVVVDCSALTETLLESELFGHVKGAFTGAVTDKAGAFEEADGGTLFLDEICDASLTMQQQLRRVLQEGEIRRVGESDYRRVNVRVICATNRNLPDQVASGRFLHDLFHRIHQFPIRLPPLRERKEDIPTLVEHFILSSGSRKNPPVRGVDPEALDLLLARDWRANNVRELQNVVQLAVDLAGGEFVDRACIERTLEIREENSPDVTAESTGGAPTWPVRSSSGECIHLDPELTRGLLAETEEDAAKEERPYYRLQREFSGKLIVETLRFTGWKLRPAARLLGISPVKLRQDFRQYLEDLLERAGDKGVEGVSRVLDMPRATLTRKLVDLGVQEEGREESLR